MADYALRAAILQTDLVKIIKEVKHNMYLNPDCAEYWNAQLTLIELDNPGQFHEACKMAKCDFNRNTRLKNRISKLMKEGSCIFLTLTFTDDVLHNTSFKTRREYVSRFLKTVSSNYVANVDFGSQFGREHYHAVIVADFVSHDDWKYGAINFKRVYSGSNPLILAKYVGKLTNHAVKETAKRNSIMYPKKSR